MEQALRQIHEEAAKAATCCSDAPGTFRRLAYLAQTALEAHRKG